MWYSAGLTGRYYQGRSRCTVRGHISYDSTYVLWKPERKHLLPRAPASSRLILPHCLILIPAISAALGPNRKRAAGKIQHRFLRTKLFCTVSLCLCLRMPTLPETGKKEGPTEMIIEGKSCGTREMKTRGGSVIVKANQVYPYYSTVSRTLSDARRATANR